VRIVLRGQLERLQNQLLCPSAALSILLYLAGAVAAFLLSLSLTIRRLHDQDKSGFWYFIAFVPFIGGIWLFVLTVLEGTPGPNRFG
jgi:uncharacterized membrane protein YhaH (DUF805 family)